MKKIRIGVLGPSDIAKRRMIPALNKSKYCEYAGVAAALPEERSDGSGQTDPARKEELNAAYKRGLEKADELKRAFDGEIYEGFMSMLNTDDIDAVYIALPPYLHAKWAKEALKRGKHVLL
ncbi:MAG: Gfo/Idh/MocA family oxidoreductase, partial [Lachnospiraceae bacterium]|nr:Gfo/Idh/MocA family oxidoreductase [Lachnospiraceae bacterium]